MDIGKFKASRGRLTAWIMIPPVLIVGLGLTSFALKLQSEWKLERAQVLQELLPRAAASQAEADALFQEFLASESGAITSEDELISFLQNAAHQADFVVDSLKVERRESAANNQAAVLTASVKGTGTFLAVQTFMGDAAMRQYLLSESSLQISQGGKGSGAESCRAEIRFELILFDTSKMDEGA